MFKFCYTLLISLLTSISLFSMPGGGPNECPDDINNSPGNSSFTTEIEVYDDSGEFVETIICETTGGSPQVECDLDPYPETYFFILEITDQDGNELECFYDGNGEIIDPIPLRVNFHEFTLLHNKDYNLLSWITLDETDNDFFTLEYSMNGTDWFHLTDLAGSGTTNTMSEYEYEHRIIGYSIIYYKLSQTDFDGTTNKLSVKAVQSSLKNDLIGLSFNNETLFISSEESISTVQIVDLSGRLVYNQQFLNSNNESINLDFNMGVYIANVIDNSGNQRSQKFVIR